MEDPAALELWEAWLTLLITMGQREEAREQALACEWPPLLDWVDAILDIQGGSNDS